MDSKWSDFTSTPLTHLSVCPSVLFLPFLIFSPIWCLLFSTSFPSCLKSSERERDRDEYTLGRVKKRLSCHLRDILIFLSPHYSFAFTLNPSVCILSLPPPFLSLSHRSRNETLFLWDFSLKKANIKRPSLCSLCPCAFSFFFDILLYPFHSSTVIPADNCENFLFFIPPHLQSVNTRLH